MGLILLSLFCPSVLKGAGRGAPTAVHGDTRQPGVNRGAVLSDHGPHLCDNERTWQHRPQLLGQARDSIACCTHAEGGLLLGAQTEVSSMNF